MESKVRYLVLVWEESLNRFVVDYIFNKENKDAAENISEVKKTLGRVSFVVKASSEEWEAILPMS